VKEKQSLALVNIISEDQAVPEVTDTYDLLLGRFGYVPNFYAAMAHHPNALKTFLPFYASILTTGAVETRYKELVYLHTSRLNQCRYCSRAHTAAAKRVGLTDQQIKGLANYRHSDVFDDKEKTILAFAEEVTRQVSGDQETVKERLKKYFSDPQIVELTLTICMANFTNRFNNALELESDIGEK
jgi:uncharacterized peroxidase-related enzyme